MERITGHISGIKDGWGFITGEEEEFFFHFRKVKPDKNGRRVNLEVGMKVSGVRIPNNRPSDELTDIEVMR